MMKRISDSKIFLISLCLILALLWGLSFVWTKIALRVLDPVEVLSVRWMMSLVFFLILVGFGIIKLEYKKTIKEEGGKKAFLTLVLAGFLQPCAYAFFEAWGIDLTTSSESSIFIGAIPLFVALEGALLFRKHLKKQVILGIILGFTGLIMCILLQENVNLETTGGKGLGYLCLMVAIVTGSSYTLLSNKLSKTFKSLEITFMIVLEGGVFFTIFSLLKGNGMNPYRVLFKGGIETFSLIYLGLGCSFLAYVIFNFILSKFEPAITTCIETNLIAAIGVVSGIIIADEPWGWYTVLGFILIVLGIVLSSMSEFKKEKDVEN